MPNIVEVEYQRSGASTNVDKLGMREMQARAYKERKAQHLLIKAPPACGKSRALMFLGLDKLKRQGIKKVIVAVPERSIGASFKKTNLKKYGFFEDWNPDDKYNLCTPGGDQSKVKAFHEFLDSRSKILICTHATLRFACEGLDESRFDRMLLAIDEFHHVSADVNNKLGELLRNIVAKSSAHVIAMTGSYFRGDSIPVLRPEDEEKFTKVTYNYYEQLNGYKHLKTLGMGYHFYQGRYTNAIMEVLDTDLKTIIHIPSPNSNESTKDKYKEVDEILDKIGVVLSQDDTTAITYVQRGDGKILKVADLVYDENKTREKVVSYLRDVKKIDDVDIIIALGMAKEGFDWPYCEHALTVGYRGSLTEVIQIIGRATRDSENKTHAQFTNLIAKPRVDDEEAVGAVNDMLKAITASLLMEQVMAPSFKFKTQLGEEEKPEPGTITIGGFKEPSTRKVRDIIENSMVDLKAAVLQDKDVMNMSMQDGDPEIINKVLIPKVIEKKFPELSKEELEEVRHHLVTSSVISRTCTGGDGSCLDPDNEYDGAQQLINLTKKFIHVEDLHIDLIDQVNPFQQGYEVLSKTVDSDALKVIHDTIRSVKIEMSEEEVKMLWPKVKAFMESNGRKPSPDSLNLQEKRLGECIIYAQNYMRKKKANG